MLRLNKQHKHDLSEIETAKTTARLHFSETKESTEKDPDYEITLFLQNSSHYRISQRTQNTNEIQKLAKRSKEREIEEMQLNQNILCFWKKPCSSRHDPAADLCL